MGGRTALLVLLLLLVVLFSLLAVTLVTATSFNCSFQASCATNATQTGLLKAKNNTGGYDDAHAELMNYSGSYPYTLCCDVDESHWINNSCADENATSIVSLAAETNSHIQISGATPAYDYDACLAVSPGNLTCEYVNTTCSAGYSPLLSMASSETNSGQYNETNAHLSNYSYYLLSVCCKIGNSPPSVPVLSYPAEGNQTVFERNVTFEWSASSDPDEDSITYDFNLTQVTCSGDNTSGIGATSFQPSSELCVDHLFNWTVRACDPYACSAWASTWNFTIASVAGLSFLTNNTDFGILNNNDVRNTTGGSPSPFLVENTGNVPLNVTFRAQTSLFTSVGLGNDSFQYAARQNETGAYQSAQTDWTNVSSGYTSLFTELGYADSADAAFIDILVRVPGTEGAGTKSSTVEVQGNYTG